MKKSKDQFNQQHDTHDLAMLSDYSNGQYSMYFHGSTEEDQVTAAKQSYRRACGQISSKHMCMHTYIHTYI